MRRLSQREWKNRSEWHSGEEELLKKIFELEKETSLSPLTLRVCLLRGLDTAEKIRTYFYPKLNQLKSPTSIKDMELAVQRIALAKGAGEKIRIYGDYDVDGTTGVALLTWVFRSLGIASDSWQPDRFRDGYGLNVEAIEEAAKAGIKLMVTVDCGITNFEAADKARELGLDLIIVDHHQVDPEKGIPKALAVVNPQREDCESGLRQLCGCGLAFYLSMALRTEWRRRNWFSKELPEPNLKQHLDLVVIATAADQVPLVGDNRILVRYGMQVLKHSLKPGVRALMATSGVLSRNLSPSHLGFALGPRINASGRIRTAGAALALLTTQNDIEAETLAQELENLNQARMQLQNTIWDQVKAKVQEGLNSGSFQGGIVLASSDWHEGVVGIVASRVVDTFHRPAIVIAIREDGIGKGSARSFGGKNVLTAIRSCGKHLLGFGGHPAAAGLSIERSRIDAFALDFDREAGLLTEDEQQAALLIDGSGELDHFDLKTLAELENLGPFGPGNPEPVFRLRAGVDDFRILKERHIKIKFSGESNLEAIWFHADKTEFLDQVKKGEEMDWVGTPELNRFRGRVTPSFRVRDWRAQS